MNRIQILVAQKAEKKNNLYLKDLYLKYKSEEEKSFHKKDLYLLI